VASRALLQTPELTLGEFVCEPGDPLWDEVNTMSRRPHVVFPRTHVLIAQEGARPALVTPNHIVFYKPHQLYRRGLRDPRGDRCVWIEYAPELGEPPPAPVGPSDPQTYLLAVALASEPRAAEEAALTLLARALHGEWVRHAPRRARTRAEHAELAEAAKELLARGTTTLSALAATLYVSPFHLARVFRAETGFSVSGYVHNLRLRTAADRLAAEPKLDLTSLALELGYCSPSHFSDRFKRAFGAAPSQLSTIMEARRHTPA
jgi:AraC family transcriptional regulator